VAPGSWALKGGFALQLRLADRARSTLDVDLAWNAVGAELLDTLIDAASRDLGDFFVLAVERTGDLADPDESTHRFRVAVSLTGRPFETFSLDVAVGDGDAGDVEYLEVPDVLGFAGVEPVQVPVVPLARQVAEKLHAYTRRYEGGRMSSRTRDLVDLALVAQLFPLEATALHIQFRTVFVRRGTHGLPASLPSPPADWRPAYRRLAQEVGLDGDVDAGHRTVAALLNPSLRQQIESGRWDPMAAQWNT
jgi:hypothetical protein